MSKRSSSNDFVYIREAAKLRQRLDRWLSDQTDAQEHGIQLLYAVDTDIVKLFSDPKEKRKYATVFNGNSDETQEALAWALGYFIFFQLTQNDQLLVIPPHHLELDRVIAGIAQKAVREEESISDDTWWQEMELQIQAYRRTKDEDTLIRFLEKDSHKLLRFAFGSGEGCIAELARITKLFKKKRLLHIDRYVERKAEKGHPWTLPVLRDKEKRKDYDDLMKLKESWSVRLRNEKPKGVADIKIEDDAEVLARLEWINAELASEGSKRRLVLITGDNALYQAANKYLKKDDRSFAEIYLRHPQVFLAALKFLSADLEYPDASKSNASDNPENELIGLLNVFFARYESGYRNYQDRFEEILTLKQKEKQAELVHDFTDDIPTFRDKWEKFVKSTMMEYGFSSYSEKIKKVILSHEKKDFEAIREEVEERVSHVKNEFWQTMMVAGYRATEANKKHILLPWRGVPALRFTLHPAQDYVRKLCQTLDYKQLTDMKISFDELKGQDESGYTGFLVYALAFGAAGQWGAVKALATRALQIADHEAKNSPLSKKHEPITGNEAAYLLAWTNRHDVYSATRLKTARRYLSQAMGRESKATDSRGSNVRYESEELALNMTYHCFQLFCDQSIPKEVPSLEECQKKAVKLLFLIEQEKEPYIRRTVQKQVLTYLFFAVFLRIDKEGEQKASVEKVVDMRGWLKKFGDLHKYEGHKTKTCMTWPIYLLAANRYGLPKKAKKCHSEAKDFFDNDAPHCRVMPYDKELYPFLAGLFSPPLKMQ